MKIEEMNSREAAILEIALSKYLEVAKTNIKVLEEWLIDIEDKEAEKCLEESKKRQAEIKRMIKTIRNYW